MTEADPIYPEPDISPAEPSLQPPGMKSLMMNSNFSKMFIGGLISDIGSFFTFIAIMFLAIDITKDQPLAQSAQAIALITVFLILPTLLIGPFTGALVDRFDRKKVMYIADIFGSIASFGLVYVALYTRVISHIYIFAFISSIVRLFFYPARGASIPLVVEKKEALVQANGIIQIFAQLSRILGPAFAGLIIAVYDLEMAFIVDGVSYLVSSILIFSIKTDLKPKVEGKTSFGQIFADLKFGAIMVAKDQVLLFMMLVFMVVIFAIGMIDPLFALYLNRNFGMTEVEFGYILSISAVTGLISALILTAKGQISRKMTFTLSSSVVGGISLMLIGMAGMLPYNPRIWLYVGMAMVGSINVLISIPFSALLQAIVKNEHLGKVNGFLSTGIAFSQVGGAALASYLATFVPITTIYTIIGIFLLSVGFLSLLLLSMLGLEKQAQEREKEAIESQDEPEESKFLAGHPVDLEEKPVLSTEVEVTNKL